MTNIMTNMSICKMPDSKYGRKLDLVQQAGPVMQEIQKIAYARNPKIAKFAMHNRNNLDGLDYLRLAMTTRQ